ncbi:hypothetical protein Btru_056922 [Bulinus truncatus]|nr:hypothetical protein Btru_056922 [Bulinus truncatus]
MVQLRRPLESPRITWAKSPQSLGFEPSTISHWGDYLHTTVAIVHVDGGRVVLAFEPSVAAGHFETVVVGHLCTPSPAPCSDIRSLSLSFSPFHSLPFSTPIYPPAPWSSSQLGTPVTLRVDEKGQILYWKDQNKEMDFLDISLIKDTRTGSQAKVPRPLTTGLIGTGQHKLVISSRTRDGRGKSTTCPPAIGR